MNAKFTYLLLDLACIAVPLLFSFCPGPGFSRKWKFALPAIFLTSVIFITWDVIFTGLGVWSFNPRYVTGIFLANLPVEEVLFFFCIPYACLFTYFALTRDLLFPVRLWITAVLIAVLLAGALVHADRIYTTIVFLITAAFLITLLITRRTNYLGRFYFSFLIILIPFFFVNGILTGSWTEEPVVFYERGSIINVRMGSIPVEDFIYAMLLMLMNVSLAEELESRSRK